EISPTGLYSSLLISEFTDFYESSFGSKPEDLEMRLCAGVRPSVKFVRSIADSATHVVAELSCSGEKFFCVESKASAILRPEPTDGEELDAVDIFDRVAVLRKSSSRYCHYRRIIHSFEKLLKQNNCDDDYTFSQIRLVDIDPMDLSLTLMQEGDPGERVGILVSEDFPIGSLKYTCMD
ncbi:MAG: hypothetical protein AAFO98_02450, partial [Pseudomonadota bacterium]